MKRKCKKQNWLLCLCMALSLVGCTTNYDARTVYNDVKVPFGVTFHTDTVAFGKLPEKCARHILNLADPSSKIVGKNDYTFRTDELIAVHGTGGDSLRITSWAAKTIRDVTVEMFVPEVGTYIPIAFLDSIPGFSQFEFKPSFVGKRSIVRKENGDYLSFSCPHLDMERMKTRLVSNDELFKKLSRIDAQWTCGFSNYDWTPSSPSNNKWKEMRPIFAREWVVIVTNYAYMMTTPEYKYVMSHFAEVMGGDLYDDSKVTFTAERYQSEEKRYKAAHTFWLGLTNSAGGLGGLGGGSTWGVSDWNFYGHYASFSGWESIGHEFMHCMGYGHDGNMTYSYKNANGITVGWTEFLWQLHLWLSHKGDLPYTDRNLLGFHKPENAKYRDCDIRDDFKDDAQLEKKILGFYNSSRLVKYFTNHPLNQ